MNYLVKCSNKIDLFLLLKKEDYLEVTHNHVVSLYEESKQLELKEHY